MTKKTEKRRRGRTRQDLTQATMDRICREVGLGRSLRRILKAKGMPSKAKVMASLQEDPHFADQYARARRQGIELHIDGILDLADSATEKNAQAVRLKVDTRKWLASKLAPKVYGDKLELQGELTVHGRGSYEQEKPIADWTRAERLEWMRGRVYLIAVTGKEIESLWELPALASAFAYLADQAAKQLLDAIEGRASTPAAPIALPPAPRQITSDEIARRHAEGPGEREINPDSALSGKGENAASQSDRAAGAGAEYETGMERGTDPDAPKPPPTFVPGRGEQGP